MSLYFINKLMCAFRNMYMILQKLQELLNFICKRIPLPFTKPTLVFNVKRKLKSLYAQAVIFHMPISLQMLQISFFTAPDIRGQEKSKCKQTMYSFVLISSMAWKQEVAIVFLKTKTRMVPPPGWGVGQPHCAQPEVGEISARGLLRTQNWVACATEVTDGSLLRDPGCCLEELGVPYTRRGTQGTPYIALCFSLRGQGSANQFSAWICYCRPGPRDSSSTAAERSNPGLLGVLLHYLLRWAEQGPPLGEGFAWDGRAGAASHLHPSLQAVSAHRKLLPTC